VTAPLERDVAGHPFFTGLPEGSVELVARCARRATFASGDLLLREGDEADTLHLIEQGRVAVEIHAPSRESLVIETVDAGHVVGLSWMAPPFRWHFDVRALTPVSTVAVDRDALRSELERRPDIGYALLGRLSSVLLERLQATRVRLLDLYGLGDDDPR
jgi:CRP-like cAMP-binding protein